jgi:hypothetical protein
MKCDKLNNGKCSVASELAKNDVLPMLVQCEYCTHQSEPSQSINRVTVSLAIKNADQSIRVELSRRYSHLLQVLPPAEQKNEGPGTELKKILSWFYLPDDSKCKCNDRIAKMNGWGAEGCEQRIETILRWLRHSAAENKIPFSETAVRMLVNRAISNARKQSV